MSRNAVRLFAVVGVVLALGCGKKAVHPSPPPPPVVAPETPPPAPTPSRVPEAAPVQDEYERLRSLTAEDIEDLGLLRDIPFDYDNAELRDDAKAALAQNAEVLKRFDFLRVTVEGHCDERGTIEYNLALGDQRSRSTRDHLEGLGVPPDRLRTASYGKEAPLCEDSTEDCWARNRRAKLRVTGVARD